MLEILSLSVHAGEIIRASVWNAMARAVTALRLRQGPGILLQEGGAQGTMVSLAPGLGVFLHPFKCTLLNQTTVQIRPGTINGVSAKVGGSELQADGPPWLTFRTPQLGANNRGYIAAELTLSNKDWSVVSVAIVQCAYLESEGLDAKGQPEIPKEAGGPLSLGGVPTLPGRRARFGLAMLIRRASGLLELEQIAHSGVTCRITAAKDAEYGRAFFG